MRVPRRSHPPRMTRWPARLPAASRNLFARIGARRPAPLSTRAKAGWLVALALFFTSYVPGEARGPLERERMIAGVRMYFAPETNLSEIDRELIGRARQRIDVAAYVLTDRTVMAS
ncbi:MAG: hypothetical protein FJX29_07635, partial [Alphaproteobacteria bacterium]|nr:hypothetical protein [Alphaproteobacteria bacterium]